MEGFYQGILIAGVISLVVTSVIIRDSVVLERMQRRLSQKRAGFQKISGQSSAVNTGNEIVRYYRRIQSRVNFPFERNERL